MLQGVKNMLARVAAPVARLGDRSLDEGVSAYQRGEYATAQRMLLPLAERGEALAQFALSEIYARGSAEVARDPGQSLAWLEKAVAQDCVRAQLRLACRYTIGDGVAQDHVHARVLYRQAADGGSARAQFAMGTFDEHGMGDVASWDRARRWYRLAAEQGHREAIRKLEAAQEWHPA